MALCLKVALQTGFYLLPQRPKGICQYGKLLDLAIQYVYLYS